MCKLAFHPHLPFLIQTLRTLKDQLKLDHPSDSVVFPVRVGLGLERSHQALECSPLKPNHEVTGGCRQPTCLLQRFPKAMKSIDKIE